MVRSWGLKILLKERKERKIKKKEREKAHRKRNLGPMFAGGCLKHCFND